MGPGLALLAALCLAPAAIALDAGDIIVAGLKGEVHVTMSGAERAVRVGAVLELPATVRTGADGAIELRQGATSVNVGPDTQLEFPALEVPGGPVDRIRQSRGNAFYDVGKRGKRKLRIETPFLVAVVKGTQFNVAASEDATTIALFEGRLEIRSTADDEVVDIVAGEIASRHRSEQDIGVIRFDDSRAAPAPSAPAGADGGDRAVPTPSPGPPHEAVPEGDEYLVRDDSAGLEEVAAAVIVDARIDLGATDALVAALVNPAPPATEVGNSPGPGIDTGGVANPGIDTGANGPVIDAGGAANPDIDTGAGTAPSPGIDPDSDGPGTAAAPDILPGDSPVSMDAGTGNGTVNVDTGAGVSPGDANTGVDVDLGLDLDGDNSNSGPGNNGIGNAYGHDKDNANGEAKGHDQDGNLLGDIVEDVVNLLDNLRKPGKK